VRAQTTNGLSDVEIQGQQLAQEILQENPITNFNQTGTIKIEDSKKKSTIIDFSVDTEVISGGWTVVYHTHMDGFTGFYLKINHKGYVPNEYLYRQNWSTAGSGSAMPVGILSQTEIMAPFAGSDFWIADLGLEFFHWPEQKVLRHESKRTRACTVLRSTNSDPTNGYSYVDSWIDDESHGIVHAEAYDTNGKLLKVFDPKSFKKVNGQWQLQDIEIRNVQTKSRTWIKFDLSSKS
jgi:hypothetical protein